MKSKKAKITEQKGRKATDQPFVLEFPGDLAKKKRYSTLRNACRAAVRHYKEWLHKDYFDSVVKIELPDGRIRIGAYHSESNLYQQPLKQLKKKKA